MNTRLIVLFNLLAISRTNVVQRIAGGRHAEQHEFPNLVALTGHIGDPLDFAVFCTGTIINEFWILSAGHCIIGMYKIYDIKNVNAMAGQWNVRKWEPSGQVSGVSRAIKHENYKGEEYLFSYDIGLFGLDKPLRINIWVRPFPLSDLSDFEGIVFIAGWGAINNVHGSKGFGSDHLNTANVTITNHTSCRKSLKTFLEVTKTDFFEYYVNHKLICTSSKYENSACHGDSGGPVMMKNHLGEYEVIAIVSFIVKPCGLPGNPSLNTKLACYLSWIDDTIKKNPPIISSSSSITVQ